MIDIQDFRQKIGCFNQNYNLNGPNVKKRTEYLPVKKVIEEYIPPRKCFRKRTEYVIHGQKSQYFASRSQYLVLLPMIYLIFESGYKEKCLDVNSKMNIYVHKVHKFDFAYSKLSLQISMLR